MDLFVNLVKGRTLDRGKLIRRPVQVRGKNGKIFTRMQWVDPRTGLPASESGHIQNQEVVGHGHSQKSFIDEKIRKMSRDEKYHHINKHGLKWEHNDHEAINHKNAVMALKDHMYKNPHLLGAEHLPKEGDEERTLNGTELVNHFVDKFKKHPEELYEMLKHAGVIDKDAKDPRSMPEHGPEGDKTGPIKHMKNMMDFKKKLRENPGLLEELQNHPKFGQISGGAPKATSHRPSTDTPKSEPTDIDGILKNMSREDKYELCRKLGIADEDPQDNPKHASNGTAPIRHMHNMMNLKKAIQKNPSLLEGHTGNTQISDEEKQRLAEIPKQEKAIDDMKEIMKDVPREMKLKWADDFKDNPIMQNRIKSSTEHIDNMHKIAALTKIFSQDPSLFDKYKPELEKHELLNMKIGNKMMSRVLREIAGLRGEAIGNLKAGEDTEKNKEWTWGDLGSFARIEEDDEGEPILSVVDTGPEGEDWNEMAFPLKDVKAFVDKVKSQGKMEGKTYSRKALEELEKQVKSKEIALHKLPPKQILEALNGDFDKNYTPEVGEALKKYMGQTWNAANKSNSLRDMKNASHFYVTLDTVGKLLEKYGVKVSRLSNNFDVRSDAWKQVAYGHLVTKTKDKNANSYLVSDENGKPDTWVLHESAKHWTPQERDSARKDILHPKVQIDVPELSGEQVKDRLPKIVNHLHNSLSHVPFDLFTDTLAKGGYHLRFASTGSDGKEHVGNHFSKEEGGITFDRGYVTDELSLNNHHTFDHIPAPRASQALGGRKLMFHSFVDTASHEFAHAIDCFLSGGDTYQSWDKSEMGKKYAKGNENVVGKSYKASVMRSNPDALIAAVTGHQPYLYHKDEWMNSYEGRIYDNRYYDHHMEGTTHKWDNNSGSLKDLQFHLNNERRGLEHWSENSARYATALHQYNFWKEMNPESNKSMDEWAKDMHKEFMDLGYSDDSNTTSPTGGLLKSYRADRSQGQRKYPMESAGYLWHQMAKVHPELAKGIKDIYGRGDFVGEKSEPSVNTSVPKPEEKQFKPISKDAVALAKTHHDPDDWYEELSDEDREKVDKRVRKMKKADGSAKKKLQRAYMADVHEQHRNHHISKSLGLFVSLEEE